MQFMQMRISDATQGYLGGCIAVGSLDAVGLVNLATEHKPALTVCGQSCALRIAGCHWLDQQTDVCQSVAVAVEHLAHHLFAIAEDIKVYVRRAAFLREPVKLKYQQTDTGGNEAHVGNPAEQVPAADLLPGTNRKCHHHQRGYLAELHTDVE
tara:strand:- start:12 stop:470 length:459 start_codon:yes stop_codon:yes gene_type:complete